VHPFYEPSGRPIDPRDHSVHWVKFLEGAGVRPARLHDARHTAATLLLVQGVDKRVVIDMLGWTSPTMTARYEHVVPELVEEGAQCLRREHRREHDLAHGRCDAEHRSWFDSPVLLRHAWDRVEEDGNQLVVLVPLGRDRQVALAAFAANESADDVVPDGDGPEPPVMSRPDDGLPHESPHRRDRKCGALSRPPSVVRVSREQAIGTHTTGALALTQALCRQARKEVLVRGVLLTSPRRPPPTPKGPPPCGRSGYFVSVRAACAPVVASRVTW